MESVRIETDDPVTDLKCQDKIRVLTQNGECSIEFYLGDICCLKPENKVDVLLVSAFRGNVIQNYDPIKGTLIGALRYQLKLNVAEYALNKAEDLREYYSCWVSHPLPEHLPFKRLLCFEPKRLRTVHPKEVVGDVFRCLVPILQDEVGTVITPILSTGKVGFRETDLMQSMVEAAVNWMKAGLPLKQLKIVQYAVFTEEGEVAHSQRRDYEGIRKLFGELKERYDMQYLMPKETLIEYDIYLSCCKEDRDVSKALLDSLKQAKPDIRVVVGSDQKMMKDESWQEEMYETMMKSARVVTVLSPRYLQSAACIEQYNIALCCNRKVHKDLLAPFYVEAVPELPSYMQLVQYVDCLSRDAAKISSGCQQLVRMLSSSSANIYSDGYMVEVNPVRYDVFLSYSHSDTAKANQIVECLQEKAPDLRIFFDVQEIKQGKAWQRLLYHSIDGSTIFIAMVSERYLKSAVCNEEYSLALAKFCTKGDPLQLCVLKTEDALSLPPEYQRVTTVSAGTDFTDKIETFCSDLVDWSKTKEDSQADESLLRKTQADSLVLKDYFVNFDEESSKYRRLCFHDRFPNFLQWLKEGGPKVADKKMGKNKSNIAISFHKSDQKYADYISAGILRLAPHLKVESHWEDNKARLATMETIDRIVALLSPNYLGTPEQVEEFHIAIWRQRMADPSLPVLYPVQIHVLPVRPTYFHIIPYVVSLEDQLWLEFENTYKNTLPEKFAKLSVSRLKTEEQHALDLVNADLIDLVYKQSNTPLNKSEIPCSSLVNIFTLRDRIKELQK